MSILENTLEHRMNEVAIERMNVATAQMLAGQGLAAADHVVSRLVAEHPSVAVTAEPVAPPHPGVFSLEWAEAHGGGVWPAMS
jgi:hypothetical protein